MLLGKERNSGVRHLNLLQNCNRVLFDTGFKGKLQIVVTELLNRTKLCSNRKGYIMFVVTFCSHNHKYLYSVV